ncbi:Di-copper centre-containing protein, partial [Conidiobolus coronatus NRRL 28638]
MKVFNLILFLLTNEIVEGQRCTNTGIRKEMKTLSEAERAAYFNAYRTMMTREPYRSQFTKMVDNHYNAGSRAHNSAFFFPWHREFLMEIERLLQKIDSSIILPYCNWSEYSSSPEDSYMFTDKYFGGNGSGNNNCINSGIFKGVTVDYPTRNKCIQREWNGGNRIGSFSSKAAIQITLNKKVSYDLFRAEVEGSIHSRVHVNLGGRSGDLAKMASPNDPFFACHHAFIDYLWAEWQVKRGKDGMEFGGGGITESSTMWPWGKRVRDVLDTKNPGLCYVYDS